MDAPLKNRRRDERLRLNPMYSSVMVDPARALRCSMLGHAYDVSASGVRIELDEPLEVGDRVTVHLDLPSAGAEIAADADVMWVNDAEDDPGPRRMALRFTRFKSAADRTRLACFLGGARRLAA